MSEHCDPLCPHQVCLPCHEHLPCDVRPEFTFRRCNGREAAKLSQIADRVNASDDTASAFAAIYETCAIGLIAWRNQNDPSTGEPIPFAVENLPDALNPHECMALIDERLRACGLTARQKKVSASP